MSLALQSERAMDVIRSIAKRMARVTRKNSNFSVRQQNVSSIHQKARRHQIESSAQHSSKHSTASIRAQDHYLAEISAGQIQRHGRQPLTNEAPARMASGAENPEDNIQKNGNANNRPVCNEGISSGTEIRKRRRERPTERVHKRIQQTMGLQSCMGVPTPSFNSEGSPTSEHLPRTLSPNSTAMGASFLEDGTQKESDSSPTPNQEPAREPLRPEDRQSSSEHRKANFGGLENTGWAEEINNWQDHERRFLQSAWRPSTLKTYKQAWISWCKWATNNEIAIAAPKPNDLARYLIYLSETRKLAARTILVHKSTVATFSKLSNEKPLSAHPLVQKVVKAILLKNPPKHNPCTWNVSDLLDWIDQRTIDESSLFQVSQHVATLLLLASGRRLHDLTLLHIDSERCIITPDEIKLWPAFGSKTDSYNFRQSGWRLLKCDNYKLNLCYWIPLLIKISGPRRSADKNLSNLFISTRGKVRAATRAIIAGWIRVELKEANINGTPGSFRSAVASNNWSKKDLDLDEVLRKGNWRSASTFFKHYYKEIRNSESSSFVLSDSFLSM